MAAGHEDELLDAWIQARQGIDGLRALQRQQGLVRQGLHGAALADVLLQVGDVLCLAGGIDHHEQVIGAARDHQVVEDAALLVGEQGVALLEGR